MKKFRFWSIVVLSFIFASCKDDESATNELPTASKPNILLIIADDMGVDAAPGYSEGTTKPNMPTLANLQAQGITFDEVWSYPVCSPTRASIITGKYGVKSGILNLDGQLSPSEKSLQAYINEQQATPYSTAVIGKWHLGNGDSYPTNNGIDYYAGLLAGAAESYSDWTLWENEQQSPSTEYITEKFTSLAIDWITAQEQPWFCWLAYTAPHTPLHLPPAGTHSQGNLPADQASIEANPLPYFMAMMENMDYEMSRLLENIPQKELDNTVIIFLGDNGTSANVSQHSSQSTRTKGSIYEGGVHVPMVVSGKGVSRTGERENNLISTADLFSTIAQIAGVTNDSYENSMSFYDLLQESRQIRETVYTEILNNNSTSRSGFAIRDHTYKYLRFDSGNERLYNLIADPFESENLLNGNSLSEEEETAYNRLVAEAAQIRQ